MQDPRATQSRKAPNFQAIVRRVLEVIREIFSTIAGILAWATSVHGSELFFAILAVYFMLVNIEGWTQALGVGVAFIPKPFIDDGALWANLFGVLTIGRFYLAAIISIVVNVIQAWVLRDKSLEQAQAEYAAIAHHQMPPENPNAVDEVDRRRMAYKRTGNKTFRMKNLALFVAYGVDLAQAWAKFPLLGIPFGMLGLHLVWFFITLAGAELFINFWRDARDKRMAIDKANPKVEVL